MTTKKHRKGEKFLLLAIVLLLTVFFNSNVYAESEADDHKDVIIESTTCEEDYAGDEAAIKKCKEDANSCFAELYPNKFEISTSLSSDKKSFTISMKNNADKEYNFIIKYEITKNGIKLGLKENSLSVKKNSTNSLKNLPTEREEDSDDIDINILAVLDGQVEAKFNDIDCNRKFSATARISIPSYYTDKVHNTSIDEPNGICYKYLNNKLKASDISESDYKELASKYSYANIANLNTQKGLGQDVLKSSYKYCFANEVTKVKTNEEVIEGLYYAARSIVASAGTSSSSEWVENPPGYKYVDDLSKVINLTCDAFSETNVRKFYHNIKSYTGSVDYHYTYDKPISVDVCEVNCRELLTITYGPPVAVKAGFCFEYEVKVESKVECNAKEKENAAPDESEYKTCEPVPTCWYNSPQYKHQAGPNEEFDQCILDTDGGKYTQKAINKCYKKIYQNKSKTTKTTLALDYEDNVVKMDNSSCITYPTIVDGANTIYYAYKNGMEGGYYTSSGSTVEWHPYGTGTYKDSKNRTIPTMSGCYWNKYSRFYFSNQNIAQRTVGNDAHVSQYWGYGYYDDLTKWKYYPEAGIKVGYAYGNRCHDVCGYDVSSCAGGQYYNEVAPKDVAAKDPRSSARDQYYKDYKAYVEAKENCKAVATCDTSTATYTMTVNNLSDQTTICAKGENDSSCTSWSNTAAKNQCEYNTNNTTNNGVTTQLTGDPNRTFGVSKDSLKSCTDIAAAQPAKGDESIIREISGVCAGVDGDSQDYRTIISFPGTWIYSKNLKYKYHNPNDATKYESVPGKFCVGTTVTTVNKAWWKWDQNTGRDESKKSTISYSVAKDDAGVDINVLNTTSDSGKNGKYNIKAYVELIAGTDKKVGFGKSNWGFEISCFYAACDGKDCEETTICPPGVTCPDPNPKSVETKTISLDDLFPATENTTTEPGSSSSGNKSSGNSSSRSSGNSSSSSSSKSSGVKSSGVKSDSLKEVTPSKLNNVTLTDGNVQKMANSTTAGRQTGYNWSCEATNLLINNYPITPTALISKIQTAGNSVYGDNSEMDYQIVLTRQNILNIREYNKNHGEDYTATGTSSKEEDNYYTNNDNFIKFYKSKMLRDSKYVSKIIKPTDKASLCNNIINRNSCDTYNYNSAENIAICSKLGN